MIKEFKEFAFKGNVLDMAVGIIIGGAFGTVVKSLVEDVLMPPIGQLAGKVDFSELKYDLGGASIKYGSFINNFISFLIVAFAVFLLVKVVTKVVGSSEKPAPPPIATKEEVLLTEIRDLLKNRLP